MQQLHLSYKTGIVPGIKLLAKLTGHKSMAAMFRYLLLEYAKQQPKEIKNRIKIMKLINDLESSKK